ncbi:MAG: M1 family metallopeptidase [Gemmatimonadota bacterium]
MSRPVSLLCRAAVSFALLAAAGLAAGPGLASRAPRPPRDLAAYIGVSPAWAQEADTTAVDRADSAAAAGTETAIAAGAHGADGPEAGAPAESAAAARFAPLNLQPANRIRTAAGAPGPEYWQQRADYSIKATLDTHKQRITGSETITYTNNSPDSLRSLWLQLDQNLFKPDSRGASRAEQYERFSGAFKKGGYEISRVTTRRDGEEFVPEYRIDDTMMEVMLHRPLPPEGAQLELTVDFSFIVPEKGADRMGRLRADGGTIYEVAQWYPRMFVYDDVHGWNNLPYLGQGEFYLEFGDFDVELTVPRNLIVVATGELTNPEQVLTARERERLEKARGSAKTVVIIGAKDVGRKRSRPKGDGPLTWKFHAENVRDVAWAASKAFLWDAAGWEGVLIMSVYPEESVGFGGFSGWERATEYLRHSVSFYSEQWYRYPYPVAINVAGLAAGMEYPMIVFCSYKARAGFLFAVTDHEIGHTWFPMVVGSDERRYAWMDEGFNTFMNYYSGIDFAGQPLFADPMSPAAVAKDMRGDFGKQAMMTMPDSVPEKALGFLAYGKPAAMLVTLRDVILGPERFDEAFRAYIERWAFKHPQPADFFRTIEDVTGEDLDWFWRGWVLGKGQLDQAVTGVKVEGDSSVVTIENRGGVVMPLDVRFIFQDGTERTRHVPVTIWKSGEVWRTTFRGKRIKNVQIDPEGLLPDTNRANNTWGRGLIQRTSG